MTNCMYSNINWSIGINLYSSSLIETYVHAGLTVKGVGMWWWWGGGDSFHINNEKKLSPYASCTIV